MGVSQKRSAELGEVAAHVLDEVLGAVGVSPVVRPVGNDDNGRRVLAQQFHATKRMDIKVVACDRLVHEVEAKRARDLAPARNCRASPRRIPA